MENERKVYEIPEFDGGNIPVTKAAEIMKKDQLFIRQGMIKGILPIGWYLSWKAHNSITIT